MKILKKPLDTVVKQLQSKRYHVKKQDNKKAYERAKQRKETRRAIDDSHFHYRVRSIYYIFMCRAFGFFGQCEF